MTYRDLSQAPLDGEPLQPGPALACKGCRATAIEEKARVERSMGHDECHVVGRSHKSPLPSPRACTPYARVSVGWFSRCEVPGEHLHEHCRVCGLRWLTAFARPT